MAKSYGNELHSDEDFEFENDNGIRSRHNKRFSVIIEIKYTRLSLLLATKNPAVMMPA